MRITTVELIQLHECCKALKRSSCMIVGDDLIGIDDCSIVAKVSLQWLLYNYELLQYLDGKILVTRDLSSFIKTITTEEYFDVDMNTISNIYSSYTFLEDVRVYRFMRANNDYVKSIVFPPAQDITDSLFRLQQMKKDDGFIRININNHIMTLFPGLLPMLKSDRVSLAIQDQGTKYLAKFTIHKKKNVNVDVFISYLYL